MPKSGVTLPTLKKSGIVGIAEMIATVGQILNATTATALKNVFLQAATLFYQLLLQNAPSPSKGNKQFPSGAVRGAIFISPGKTNKPNVIVGIGSKNGGNYVAMWYEFGTRKQPARPFFRPALQQTKAPMGQIIAAGIQKTVTDAATQ